MDFYIKAPFPARTCRSGCTYLQLWLQIFVGSDAVHCNRGCSALRGRLQCTVSWTDLSIPKCITRYWGDVSQWSENLKMMYRLTDYME